MNTSERHVAGKEGSSDSVSFLARRSYRLSALVGRDSAVSTLVNTVSDTGAGKRFIHKRRTDPAWRSYIHLVKSSKPLSTSKRVKKFCGIMYFAFRSVEFRARAPFPVIQNLAAVFVCGMTLINHLVRDVIPGQKKTLFYCSRFVAIAGQHSLTSPTASPAV